MSTDEQNTEVEDTKRLPESAPAAARTKESRSVVAYILIAVAIALGVRLFVVEPFLVSGTSMQNTFHTSDYLIVRKFSACIPFTSDCLEWGTPKRGEVIVFHLPPNPSETLIKRVIGLPGDTVELRGTNVTIINAAHPKGFTLSEPYIAPEDSGGPTGETVTLGPDQYFVMGDNRRVSYDSRSWGLLPRQDIIGEVILRLYPFNEIGILPGEAYYQQ